jgi:N-acetylmuramic acid 6-phosphate etherase
MTSAEPITERRDAALADLDLLPTAALVERIADEDARVAPAVRAAVPALAAAVDAIVARLDAGGRLVYVGAGSSGRLALIDAAELGPTFGVGSDQVIAIIAGGPTAQATAQEAAEDDDAAGASDLAAAGVTAADAVVALSAQPARHATRARSWSPSSAPKLESSSAWPTSPSSRSSAQRSSPARRG